MSRSTRSLVCLVAGMVVLSVLGGCGGGPQLISRTNFVEFTTEQRLEIEAQGEQHYRIQEGDQLMIAFPYERSLTQDGVLVLSDGSISLVGVDRVEVANKTVTEADSLITQVYAREYLEPDLSVIVTKTLGRQIYVTGEVKDPGMHRLPAGGIDILGAISVAGGFNGTAAKSGTVLVRVTETGYLVQEINLDDISSLESIELATIQLEPYDVIYVPRTRAGDFKLFTENVLAGVGSLVRIASEVKYLSNGGTVRF
jgi:protein involved in polysaccharide export with SLBB domain